MKKKLMYCLGICYFIFSMSGLATAEEYYPEPEFVSPINVNGLEYEFVFECLGPPSQTYGDWPHGVEELQGGTLFFQHEGGFFNYENQSIGVYIDDVYFGSLYTGENPAVQQGIYLDWHQLNSIAGDGVATVRIVNSDDLCSDPVSTSCPGHLPGSMEVWLVYDGMPVSCDDDVAGVAVDIKPTSCPNPINMKRKTGVLPVAVLGTDMLDITQIDPATIKLEGVAPLRWSVEDVSAPYIGDMEGCYACSNSGPDNYDDLTLKFKYAEIMDAIDDDVSKGDCLMLELTGTLIDGTPFAGKDVVRIKKKKKNNKKKSKCNCDCDN
ncbi:MAG: hypothetical protein ABFR31_03025 [Thermodesulfobacteriota bacterium]